jgi:hypothetical protein
LPQEVLLEAQPRRRSPVRVHGAAEVSTASYSAISRRSGTSFRQRPLVELRATLAHLVGEDAGADIRLVDDGEGPHRWDTGGWSGHGRIPGC